MWHNKRQQQKNSEPRELCRDHVMSIQDDRSELKELYSSKHHELLEKDDSYKNKYDSALSGDVFLLVIVGLVTGFLWKAAYNVDPGEMPNGIIVFAVVGSAFVFFIFAMLVVDTCVRANPYIPHRRGWYRNIISKLDMRLEALEESARQLRLNNEKAALDSMEAQKRRFEMETKQRQQELDHRIALAEMRKTEIRVCANKESMATMSGRQFEEYVAEAYRTQGFTAEITPGSGDHGIDIILRRDDEKIAVQCKRKEKTVGQPPVRDLYGVIMHGGFDKGILVTNSTFSKPARDFAEGKKIELLDGDQLGYLATGDQHKGQAET